ncbi:MAG: RNA polymerase sigma factor [Pseudonocardiaceae bacterium]
MAIRCSDDVEPRVSGMADLVRSAAAGDEAAWEAIVVRYSGLLWHVVRAHRLDDTEAADVVQTTWVRLVEHLGRIREPEAVGAWLATTARRESLRVLRRADRERPTDDGAPLEIDDWPEAGPEARALTAEVNRVLWRCVDELPERHRILLRLLMADPPPTYEEISAILGMRIGSIGPTRARCLERLRRSIERTGVLAEAGGASARCPA